MYVLFISAYTKFQSADYLLHASRGRAGCAMGMWGMRIISHPTAGAWRGEVDVRLLARRVQVSSRAP